MPGLGPSEMKLSVAVGAIENLETWKVNFEASTCKAQNFLHAKIEILDEKVKVQAAQINYLEEILEIEAVEEMEHIDRDTGARARAVKTEGDEGVTNSEGGTTVKMEEMFRVSKELGGSKQIKVSLSLCSPLMTIAKHKNTT